MFFRRGESYVYFYLLLFLHSSMKACLGFYLADTLSLGFNVYVFPFSLLLNARDVVFIFIVAFLIDRIPHQKVVRIVQWISFFPIYYITIKSYIIYLYFHGFVNFGLDQFLGANGNETLNFVWYALDKYAFLFLFFVFIGVFGYVFFFTFLSRYFSRRPLIPFYLTVIAVPFCFLPLFVSDTSTGNVEPNPTVNYVYSYLSMPSWEKNVGTAGFVPPATTISEQTSSDYQKLRRYIPPSVHNVLVVFVESTPFNRTFFSGDTSTYPFLRMFSEHTLVFDNYRTFFPGTTRSMIGALCGAYSGTTFTSLTNYFPSFPCDSLPAELRKNGYVSGFFSAVDMRYDNFDMSTPYRDFDVTVDASFLRQKYRSQKRYGTGSAVEEELAVKELVAFMNSHDRFFAFYYVYWTHSPYETPFSDNAGLSSLTRYQNSQKYIDSVLRKLVARMNEDNLFRNTVLLVTADHGEAFGEHPNNFTHGNHLFEESIHIPMILYHPSFPRRSLRVHRFSSHLNMAPTVADIAGITPSNAWKHDSLLADVFTTKPLLLFARAIEFENGIIDGQWKFFYNKNSDKKYLFNLAHDPNEKNNLISRYPRKEKRYNTIVNRWLSYIQHRFRQSQKSLKD